MTCAGAAANDKNPGSGAGREALGRSRGGLSTKIRLLAGRRCRPLTRIVTPGRHGDCPRFIPLPGQLRIARRGTGRPRVRPGAAMGDKAYCSAANTAGRCFSTLRQFRAVATRYGKRARICQGTVDVASIRIWLRDPP